MCTIDIEDIEKCIDYEFYSVYFEYDEKGGLHIIFRLHSPIEYVEIKGVLSFDDLEE